MTALLFGDRYQVGDTLGFGGMSEVHRGRDLRLGRDVAIKVLRADLARDPSFQARFRREAQNAASLNHPAIVAVYDTGETKSETGVIPYIVMEFVDGETLRDLLKREGPLAPKRAMEIMADVCAALDFSHRHGIVHRDIKPANVMLTKAGAVKVMDFGIARAVADGQATMTATAAVIGTAQYLSPEQARGEAVDARSDVYATGCVLFELLTGAPPFTGDSPVAVAYQHVRQDPKAPSEVKPGLPKELDAIVLKALNKNPLNRYQTAAEMRSDLVRALSGQAVLATPYMTDEEKTEYLRPVPQRVGPPPLLAQPRKTEAEELWEDEPPNKTRRVWGFIGIGVLCAILLAGAIFFTIKVATGDKPVAKIAVPSVLNENLTAAASTLTAKGLKVGLVTDQASTDALINKVVNQDPSGGTLEDTGHTVDLVIGTGVALVPVPNLLQLSPDAAKASLTQLGLLYKSVTATSDETQLGTVIRQDQQANSQVKPGTTVTVTIGGGPRYVKIPTTGVVGVSYDAASAALKAAGLSAIKISTPSVLPLNTVISLGAGMSSSTQLQLNTPVTLNVSDNSLFVMPNLQNQTPAEAVAALQLLGAKVTTTSISQLPVAETDRTLVGVVQGQAPVALKSIPKTSVIVIDVGVAKQVTVPNVVSPAGVPLTADQAAALVSESGLTNARVATQGGYAPTPALAETVYAQSIPPSGQVDFDTEFVYFKYGPAAPVVTTTSTTTTTSSAASSSSAPPATHPSTAASTTAASTGP